jgi:hypothetical protein
MGCTRVAARGCLPFKSFAKSQIARRSHAESRHRQRVCWRRKAFAICGAWRTLIPELCRGISQRNPYLWYALRPEASTGNVAYRRGMSHVRYSRPSPESLRDSTNRCPASIRHLRATKDLHRYHLRGISLRAPYRRREEVLNAK